MESEFLSIEHPRRLYNRIFPNAKGGDFNPDPNLLEFTNQLLVNIKAKTAEIKESTLDSDSSWGLIESLSDTLKEIKNQFHLKKKTDPTHEFIDGKGTEIRLENFTLKEMLSGYESSAKTIHKLLEFETDYAPNNPIQALAFRDFLYPCKNEHPLLSSGTKNERLKIKKHYRRFFLTH